jgi:hypothetical protein
VRWDYLTIKFEHKAQYTVGRRVLGPKIDREIADSGFCHTDLTSAVAPVMHPCPWNHMERSPLRSSSAVLCDRHQLLVAHETPQIQILRAAPAQDLPSLRPLLQWSDLRPLRAYRCWHSDCKEHASTRWNSVVAPKRCGQ